MKKQCLNLVAAAMAFAAASTLPAAPASLIHVEGAIGPATAGYISRALDLAADNSSSCLVIRLDTPGGLLDSTKSIVQSFYGAKVPVVVYVAPSGANAGSAGVFITMAADVAAMAPNTSIGAAHPVTIGGAPGGGGGEQDEVMKQKMENFAISYIEAIAEKRGRNVEWAKSAVKESASITSETALELNVIDLIADDVSGLLTQIDGREINGTTIETAGAPIEEIPMSTHEKVFQVIWRPEVMFILMLIAIYGLIGELSNPGAIIPGVVGAIALILVLYMSAVLPVNVAGIALIVLAVGLFVTEAFVPSHGLLSIGGIVAFFLGAMMLFDSPVPAFRLSLAFVIPATLVTAAFFIFVISSGLKAQFLPVRAGRETMIGKSAQVLPPVMGRRCRVFIEGEHWNAESDAPVEEGQTVEIVGVTGLTLKVKPKS